MTKNQNLPKPNESVKTKEDKIVKASLAVAEKLMRTRITEMDGCEPPKDWRYFGNDGVFIESIRNAIRLTKQATKEQMKSLEIEAAQNPTKQITFVVMWNRLEDWLGGEEK